MSTKTDAELPAHTYRIYQHHGFVACQYTMETDNGWFTLDPTHVGKKLYADAKAVIDKVYGAAEAERARFVVEYDRCMG